MCSILLKSVFARVLCNVMMRNLMRVYDGGKNTFHFLFVFDCFEFRNSPLEDKLLKRVRL